MTQTAVVTRLLQNGRAEVLVERESACGHDCADCGGCAAASSPRVTAAAENPVGAKPGDVVAVESESRKVLVFAAIVYLLPFALLFAGYFLGADKLGLGEGGSFIIGLAGLAIGLVLSIALDRHLRKAGGLSFRITEVVHRCSDM